MRFLGDQYDSYYATHIAYLVPSGPVVCEPRMRTQLTSQELLQRVRLSGLVRPEEYDAIVVDMSDGGTPPKIRAFLDRLVHDNLLTPFHADRLIVGKYKGFRLGNHVILDRLGSGGMGQVFLAEHADLCRRAAIKVLSQPVAEDEVARERFHREARAAATLDHPNIVRVFDLNQEGQILYLVMEFIEGINLQAMVARSGPFAAGKAASYVGQAALGLQHAHEKGLIHRDVKPGNMIVDRIGVCRLLDLGLVRSSDPEDSQLTMNLNGQGILGTVDYLAPEQAVDSSDVDARADVYSLGATLYFLLAGHPMFPNGRAAQKLMWQQSKDPVDIRQLRPEVPDGLATVIHRALAKNPADRFQTAAAMAAELARFAVTSPPEPGAIADAPFWRGLRRTTDSGSTTRLGASGQQTGRIETGSTMTPPPRNSLSFGLSSPGSPSASTRLQRPGSSAVPIGGLDRPIKESITDEVPSPALSVGASSILSRAEAKKLAEIYDSSEAGRSVQPVRNGVPLPIAIGMMVLSAVVTGAVIWIAVTL